jgi:DNA-binding transcriptional MerR regulator
LRFYDREGLLSPSQISESGYRLYSDEDLASLQQILALKYLGFSLDEIRVLLQSAPQNLADVLSQQKRMMRGKREQIDGIIQAIEETEGLLRTGNADWESLVKVIQVIQMEQNNDWAKKYFTPEQLEKMRELGDQSYTEDAKQKLAARSEWTEEDQKRVDVQWAEVNSGIQRLAASGADPAGDDAQAVVAQYKGLIAAFTGGDPEIAAGLNKFWEAHSALPEGERPIRSPYSPDEQAFLDKALAAYNERNT